MFLYGWISAGTNLKFIKGSYARPILVNITRHLKYLSEKHLYGCGKMKHKFKAISEFYVSRNRVRARN